VREKALLRTLTKAEWRVFMALDSDMPEKQIATDLQTTGNTLHSHIKSIYRRLGVQSRLSAIAILRRAEREVLFEELHTSRTPEDGANGGNGGWDARAAASPSCITIVPPPENVHRSVSFAPYAGSDLRVG
jgi:DNA-binding CsgD family transcriptional regulator